MSVAGRYVSLFLMACGYAGEQRGCKLKTQHIDYDLGFAMTLVWVSNAVPRPPAYGFSGWLL
jgi:hypothetical protein